MSEREQKILRYKELEAVVLPFLDSDEEFDTSSEDYKKMDALIQEMSDLDKELWPIIHPFMNEG
jgi:hypothetical protein